MPYKDPEKRREHGRIYAKKWYAENLERAREISRESERRRRADPAIRAAKNAAEKARRAANPEEVRARDRKNCKSKWAKNPEKYRGIARAGYHRRKAENPEKIREISRRRRARKRGAFVAPITPDDVARMMDAQGGKCLGRGCGADLMDGYHLDHAVPLAGGGAHEPGNAQLLCPACNRSKSDRDPTEWAIERGGLF